ncbi:insulinase family protein [Atopobacter phocae]|uniref:insulinase family protein n=1 Tax=Atopobacter phocae TaxID=136492 RepID=UPI0004B44C90|nr:insulinase family protein [Atopobacter phocae]
MFQLITKENLPDIQSEGHLYVHEKTGAKVLLLKNDDSNKAFTIGFKTPPYNDNGIAHILEHSVLNGSKKFPSKEPFVELIKGSLNTFVNAMTFSDKTIYPVASTNQKDFMNLMHVYLDAVFQPNMLTNPLILAQEGWHYHLEDENSPLIYKGVVYNEMKGALASPEALTSRLIPNTLYEGSIYAFESGGTPAAIPSLTQEEFVAFHQKYYHPSNSFTVVYGDFNDEVVFNQIGEYFDAYDRLAESVDLRFEATSALANDLESTYSITAGEDPTGKDYLTLSYHVGTASEPHLELAFDMLSEILLGNNQSPLKQELIKENIAEDVYGGAGNYGFPTVFSITLKETQSKYFDRFETVVRETLEGLVQNGIDKDLIEAAFNKMSFRMKELAISESEPRGVMYAITSLGTWLYDESPFNSFRVTDSLKIIKERVNNGWFERLIQERLLDTNHKSRLSLVAEPGKNDRIEEQVLEQLKEYKESLSKDEINQLIEETQALIQRQETPDRPEDLDKIPMLKKEDLTTNTPDYEVEQLSIEKSVMLHVPQFTAGLDYLNCYFDISDMTPEEYMDLSLLSQLLTQLGTESYAASELQTVLDVNTGGVSSFVEVYEKKSGELRPFFAIRGKALQEKFNQLVDLIKEIVTKTDFSKQADITQVVQSALSHFELQINFSANHLAMNRALSHHQSVAKLKELIQGIDQYNYLKTVRDEIKEKGSKELATRLAKLLERVIKQNRLTILYVGEHSRQQEVMQVLRTFVDTMEAGEVYEAKPIMINQPVDEAFIVAQDVNYVALATNVKDKVAFSGTHKILETILRFDYLWNTIRVRGGAYGASFIDRMNGDVGFSSYRDPNIDKTYTAYEGVPAFIASLELSNQDLLKSMIGTMSLLDRPISAYHKGVLQFSRFVTGYTAQDTTQLKQEVLNTTLDQLHELAKDFETVIEQGTKVVIGNKGQIEDTQELFSEIKVLN